MTIQLSDLPPASRLSPSEPQKASRAKCRDYDTTIKRIKALIATESDWISVLATVACELHHSFAAFSWTGFYRHTEPGLLKVGPYQGSHGCLQIPFNRGVCGRAAREKTIQIVPNVNTIPDHIACSATTQSEIVLPICDSHGGIIAVLDIDSDQLEAFDEVDEYYLKVCCQLLSQKAAAAGVTAPEGFTATPEHTYSI